MMLEPSIDTLLDKIDSKYSLVVLEAKRAHELKAGEKPMQDFVAVKPTLQALEEIAAGNVTIHPSPEAKRDTLSQKQELHKLYGRVEEARIREQIEREQQEEEERNKTGKPAKTETDEGDIIEEDEDDSEEAE